jgi:ABC-2 type transport system permease protein
MARIWTIARREYKQYFSSPIAYIVAFIILLIVGLIFYLNIVFAVQSQGQFAPGVDGVLAPIGFLFVFTLPAITMRLVTEEQSQGTIELLLTAPVRDWEVVTGKWLGAWLFIITVLSLTLVYPIILNRLVSPGIDQGVMVTGYLGLFLLAAAYIGLGVAISSFFSNQIASFIATMGTFVVVWWLIGPAGQNSVSRFGAVLRYLDFNSHFSRTALVGVIDLSDIIYYASIVTLGLVLGTLSLESRRWR